MGSVDGSMCLPVHLSRSELSKISTRVSWKREGWEHRARVTASQRQHEAEWLLSSPQESPPKGGACSRGFLNKDTEHTEDTHLASALGEMGPKG